jgi:hypothetical protein
LKEQAISGIFGSGDKISGLGLQAAGLVSANPFETEGI